MKEGEGGRRGREDGVKGRGGEGEERLKRRCMGIRKGGSMGSNDTPHEVTIKKFYYLLIIPLVFTTYACIYIRICIHVRIHLVVILYTIILRDESHLL